MNEMNWRNMWMVLGASLAAAFTGAALDLPLWARLLLIVVSGIAIGVADHLWSTRQTRTPKSNTSWLDKDSEEDSDG